MGLLDPAIFGYGAAIWNVAEIGGPQGGAGENIGVGIENYVPGAYLPPPPPPTTTTNGPVETPYGYGDVERGVTHRPDSPWTTMKIALTIRDEAGNMTETVGVSNGDTIIIDRQRRRVGRAADPRLL